MVKMGKSSLLSVVVALVLSLGVMAVPQEAVEAMQRTIHVPDDYQTIQQAVNNARAGDTIIVRDGVYRENLNVTVANLTIRSENGTANCFLHSVDPNTHALKVVADYVDVSGFTVENATGWHDNAGIYLSDVSHCNISDNKVPGNGFSGIYLDSSSNNVLMNNIVDHNHLGIYLRSSSNNQLMNNRMENNSLGIHLRDSEDNILTNNTVNEDQYDAIYLLGSSRNTLSNNIANASQFGIRLFESSNNNSLTNNIVSSNYWGIYLGNSSNDNLAGNTMFGNTCDFEIGGGCLSHYIHNIDSNNRVDGKTVYYWVNQQKQQVPSDAGFVGIVNSTNILVSNLTLTNSSYGVLFIHTTDSRIENDVNPVKLE